MFNEVYGYDSVFVALALDHCNSFDIKNTFIHKNLAEESSAKRIGLHC